MSHIPRQQIRADFFCSISIEKAPFIPKDHH